MIAGIPGAGKTAFAQWYALRLAQQGLDGIYFSADSDAGTMTVRAASMLTGHPMTSVEAALATGGEAYYEEILAEIRDLRFVFESSPTLDDIDLEVAAFEETYGKYPDTIWIDNILNVAFDNGDEWSSIRELSKVLHHIARKTGSAVFCLHHASESEGKPNLPPARKLLQGKISQMPELILTLARQDDELRVACVKNRSGWADATAQQYLTLWASMERMQFFDSKYQAIAAGVVAQ